jgi:hypothetical protein
MKILGVVPAYYGCSYIVEMSSEELGTIVKGNGNLNNERVGSVVKVGGHWKRVSDIDQAQRRLDDCASSIRAIAELLGTIKVVVPPETEPAKEGGDA